MPVIRLKRGERKNLPLLSSGELAFTTDSNELFAGTILGNNVNLTPFKNNLLINGDFQRALTQAENASIMLQPGLSAYAFGNYFFKNQSDSNGNFTFLKDTTQRGYLSCSANSCKPLIEYRIKYYRNIIDDTNYSYNNIDGMKFTLSFDYNNTTSNPISFECGCVNNFVAATLGANTSGRHFATFTYASSGLLPLGYPFFNVTLFKVTSGITGNFTVGNFKLEHGAITTPFYPNPISMDNAFLKDQYYERTFSLRPSIVTVNSLQLNIGDITTATVYNPKVQILRIKIYNLLGILQNGFSAAVTFNNSSGLAEASFTKIAHLLSDAMITGMIIVDNRP